MNGIATYEPEERFSQLDNERILFRIYADDPPIFHHLTEPLDEVAAAEFIALPLELFRAWSEENGGPRTVLEQSDGPTYCRLELLSWAREMLRVAEAKVKYD